MMTGIVLNIERSTNRTLLTVSRATLFTMLIFAACVSATRVSAQTGTATINGQITDPQERIVPNVAVQAINTDTNVSYPGKTNNSGIYSIGSLPPGPYRVLVRGPGFKEINSINLVLHTQDTLEQNFQLEVGSVSESVTVNANATNDNPAVSMTVDREFVENMPLNGRSFQDLIQLAPGTVSAANGTGYFSIDGQRTDSNNFTVDGVSANLGGVNNGAGGFGSGLAGASPSQTALGTTQSLVSVDALQEFTIQTSGYTAEYGRNPGGQVAFTTRSGTNEIHGSAFDYLRNTVFDANSYSNDYFQIPKTAEHQNDFGGTLGGPVVIPKLYDGKNKTFFFFSYEGLRLLVPQFESEYVPTQAFRQWASPNVQPFLNASPLPNGSVNQDGCTIPNPTNGLPTACDALFAYGYSAPRNLDNISIRLDHDFAKRLHTFVRYADTPSSLINGAEEYQQETINVHTWTAGLTLNISNTLLDDFRFNYSHDEEDVGNSLQSVGGSVPWARDLVIPVAFEDPYAYGSYTLYVPGTALYLTSRYSGSNSAQHQYQFVDYFSWTRGTHSLKFGGDWRRLTPLFATTPYISGITFDALSDIQEGYVSRLYTGAIAPGKPVFDNLSLYAQDHWRISQKLSVDYGLRWEFNPPPGPSNGTYPAVLTSSNLAVTQLAPFGTNPYNTTYDHFAPRLGFAWNAISSQSHPLTLRGGFGVFYDTGQNASAAVYGGNPPFAADTPTQTEVPLPLSSAALAPPILGMPLEPPYPYLSGILTPDLTLPYTEQWNVSVDEMLNPKNTLTASYVGNIGRKLLFTQSYESIPGNLAFPNGFAITNNGARSNYNALQVQDRGRIANGLDFIGSFTWAHALDNSSTDAEGYLPQYGNSDNDLRRVLNLSLNYQTPTAGSSRWEKALTGGWVIANRFAAQSGYPLNVVQGYVELPDGVFTQYSPDLVPGIPIYLHGAASEVDGEPVPGNWRLNPAAFAAVPVDPTTGNPIRQGTLGRNYLRMPPFWTLNTSLQRSFSIREQLRLIFRVDAFNIFNHPNLSDPDTYLPDSTFGELIGGSVTTIGSSNQLYAMGAARSLQFSLKLQF